MIEHWYRLPRGAVESPSWRSSKVTWTTAPGVPAWAGVGQNGFQRSFPTSNILWFCGLILYKNLEICYFYYKNKQTPPPPTTKKLLWNFFYLFFNVELAAVIKNVKVFVKICYSFSSSIWCKVRLNSEYFQKLHITVINKSAFRK